MARVREESETKKKRERRRLSTSTISIIIAFVLCGVVCFGLAHADFLSVAYTKTTELDPKPLWPPKLNTAAYNSRMLALAHYVPPVISSTTSSSTLATLHLPVSTASTSVSIAGQLWPHATVYPNGGAILPFNRIVAYYGNFYSKQMGVLGEYPPDTVLAMLASTTKQWEAADPSTPVIPAIQYIAVVAQASAGADGMYRARMPDSEIDKALDMANQIHGLLFLDVQVGLSTVQQEIPLLKKYLEMPNVELAIDPEFSMSTSGERPGRVIGTYDATAINWTANYLAGLVDEYHLPPKVLVVHRFTYDMVTNYQNIKPLPEVEVVMDMDGWGSKAKKYGTYNAVIAPDPVQFTGIKLFYKNDLLPPSTGMLTPAEVLKLNPSPIYIQYQ